MSKSLSIATMLVIIALFAQSVLPVSAAPNSHASDNAQQHIVTNDTHDAHGNSNANTNSQNDTHTPDNKKTESAVEAAEVNEDPSTAPTNTPTPKHEEVKADVSSETCDPSLQWKNHGAYVSCVAHTHPGGQVVAAAAKSDIGKKHGSVSVTPSVSPSVSPSASPSVEPSVSPITSAENSLALNDNFLANNVIGHTLAAFIDAIKNFFQTFGKSHHA